MRNLATSLRQRARPDPMGRYDSLPCELRAWLCRAALPWSPASALRIWQRSPDPADALRRLTAAEARLLAKDAAKVWGRDHPDVMKR